MPKRLIGDIWSWYQVGTNLIKNILFSGWAHFSNTKNLKLRKLGCSIISVTPRGKEYSIINIINLNPSSELTTALEFTTQGNKIKIWKCWEPLYSRPNCSHEAWGKRVRKKINRNKNIFCNKCITTLSGIFTHFLWAFWCWGFMEGKHSAHEIFHAFPEPSAQSPGRAKRLQLLQEKRLIKGRA